MHIQKYNTGFSFNFFREEKVVFNLEQKFNDLTHISDLSPYNLSENIVFENIGNFKFKDQQQIREEFIKDLRDLENSIPKEFKNNAAQLITDSLDSNDNQKLPHLQNYISEEGSDTEYSPKELEHFLKDVRNILSKKVDILMHKQSENKFRLGLS